MNEPRFTSITVGSDKDSRPIAVCERKGTNPGLFWLGGFKSDMKGTKAEALDRWAEKEGRACLRFDYSGHGESGGSFTEGTISRWLEESLAVYLHFARGPQLVIGSSMGGWLALLLARAVGANNVAAPIHNRMPVVFADPRWWDAWFDPASQADELVKMLQPADDDLLEVCRVTRDLLKVKVPDASVLAPVAVAPAPYDAYAYDPY